MCAKCNNRGLTAARYAYLMSVIGVTATPDEEYELLAAFDDELQTWWVDGKPVG